MAVAIRQDAYIGGEWVPGDGEEIEVRSPATDELLGTVTASSPAQVEAAVRAAAEAFPPGARSRFSSGWSSAGRPSRSAWSGPTRSPR